MRQSERVTDVLIKMMIIVSLAYQFLFQASIFRRMIQIILPEKPSRIDERGSDVSGLILEK